MKNSFEELDNLDDTNENELINQNPYFNSNINNIKPREKFMKNTEIAQNNSTFKPMPKKNKKKTISYDDILSSMNTVVIDGKLEFIRNDSYVQPKNNVSQEIQPQIPQKKFVKIGQTSTQQQQQQQQISPEVKNSYIFNKYFKDYKEPFQQTEQQIPLTKQQIIKNFIIEKVKRHNDNIRISQVKSTKLLFNNNSIIRSAPVNNPNGSNHLFSFKN